MIVAREKDFPEHRFQNRKEVEDLAEQTAGTLLYLSLEAAGVRDIKADHAASHLGKALGLVTLLRSAPFLASQRRKVRYSMFLLLLWPGPRYLTR